MNHGCDVLTRNPDWLVRYWHSAFSCQAFMLMHVLTYSDSVDCLLVEHMSLNMLTQMGQASCRKFCMMGHMHANTYLQPHTSLAVIARMQASPLYGTKPKQQQPWAGPG